MSKLFCGLRCLTNFVKTLAYVDIPSIFVGNLEQSL